MVVMPRPSVALALLLAGSVVACLPTAPADSPFPSLAPATPSPSPSFVRPTPTPLPSFALYVVRRGDTLSTIASRFRTSGRSLAYWNRGGYPSLDPESGSYAPNRIRAGWVLRLIPGVEVDEDALPAPSRPVPSPSLAGDPSLDPSGAGPSPSGPTVGQASAIVRHGPRDSNLVALTFELSGSLTPAIDIMDQLIQDRIPATIFTTGETGTTTDDGVAILELVASHRDLFSLGNLSWSFPDLRGSTDAAIRDQLVRTENAVVASINVSTKPWFRPPYGEIDDQIPATAGAAGWSTIVLWDVDSMDGRSLADGGPSADAITKTVVGKARAGSIIRLHLGGDQTLAALPGIVDGLEARGLTPVTMERLLRP